MNIGWNTGGPPMAEMSATTAVQQLPLSLYAPQVDPQDKGGPPGNNNCKVTESWDVLAGFTNIYNRMPPPTNETHGTLHFIGEFDTADECFAAVNASNAKPHNPPLAFHSWTWNDATVKSPYVPCVALHSHEGTQCALHCIR